MADFPQPPIVEPGASFELPCSQLADAFAAVEHAISPEETRYYLDGVYLHPCQTEPGGLDLRFVATDGHRLAQLTLDAPASLGDPGGAARFPCAIVGSATVGLLDKLCASAIKAAGAKEHEGAAPPRVEIAAASDARLIRWAMPCGDGGTIVVTAKTVDGEYPDYTRVVPAAPPLRALIARGPLAEAVKRVAVLGDTTSRAVKAIFAANLLTLEVTTPGLGEGREEVPCSYQGPEFTLGLNSRYWRDALGALATDTVAMGFAEDPRAAVLLRGWGDAEESDRLVQVLMPMRV